MSDPDTLVKLVRLLSSNNDGEVLGAVRAMERILKKNGFSFHDLAESLAGRMLEVTKIKIVEKVVEVDRSQKDWVEACEKILSSGKTLSEKERRFVEDMLRSYRLSPDYNPSEKQTNWFVMIYRRHVGELRET